jgi:hypothetical protein
MGKQISDEERKAKNAAREERESRLISAFEHVVGGHLLPWQKTEIVKLVRQHNSGQPIVVNLPDGRVFNG